MVIKVLQFILMFFTLLFLQVFIVGKLNINPLVQPNILVWFFLSLPINLKPIPSLLYGFVGGLVLDMFTDSAGFHSTSLLIVCYARIYYIRSFAHLDIVESGVEPSLSTMGSRWFSVYAAMMILLYHLCYAFIESFSLRYIPQNLLSALLSAAVSLGLILVLQLLFIRSKPRV